MKKQIIIFGLLLLIAGTIAPQAASAQSSRRNRESESITFSRGRSSSLSKKINKLDDDAQKDVPLPILFGLTPDNLTPNFGDPRSGHTHEGLDIMAAKRALIVTPTDAVVTGVGTGGSSGYYVNTANPGGESFVYMHLDEMSELTVGDELKVGDFIGYVGNTGNASGGPTHLHFEIRNEDREATDPFLRIKSIFPLADKIEYLEKILDSADDEEDFAESTVKMYRKELVLARTLEIDVPKEIKDALESVPVSADTAVYASSNNISNGILNIGSRGAAVTTLQKFLIKKNIGLASRITADGIFGSITKEALKQYQASVGLSADGVYGPTTKAYISSHP